MTTRNVLIFVAALLAAVALNVALPRYELHSTEPGRAVRFDRWTGHVEIAAITVYGTAAPWVTLHPAARTNTDVSVTR